MRLGINARFLAAPVTGVQRFAREVTARLLELCDVTLYLPAAVSPPPEWRARASLVAGRLRGQAWEQLELPAQHQSEVMLHLANTSPLRRRGPSVLMLHDLLPLLHPEWYGPAFAAWYRVLISATARRATHILTTSSPSARTIATTLGIDAARITAVPQGLAPFDRPAPPEQARRTVERLGVSGRYVLALGAGDVRKQTSFVPVVLDEYARNHGERPRLVLVGSASRRVHGRNASGDGECLGRVSDDALHALYTCADAVLSPALAEGFGRVPLEALCCGTPCLVGERPGAEETLAGTPARLLPLRTDAWASALHQVLSGRERVPPAVGERLRQRWTWAAAAAAVHTACEAAWAGACTTGRAASGRLRSGAESPPRRAGACTTGRAASGRLRSDAESPPRRAGGARPNRAVVS